MASKLHLNYKCQPSPSKQTWARASTKPKLQLQGHEQWKYIQTIKMQTKVLASQFQLKNLQSDLSETTTKGPLNTFNLWNPNHSIHNRNTKLKECVIELMGTGVNWFPEYSLSFGRRARIMCRGQGEHAAFEGVQWRQCW